VKVNDQTNSSAQRAGTDHELLHRKYREERDKRLRGDGVNQYVRLDTGSEYLADPFSSPVERELVTRKVRVAILGGGFSGLITGALLRKAGEVDLVIIEDGGDFGGTWYWNRYPGARCDIESYIYLPLLEEVGYIPTERYARTTEIFAHARRLGEHFGLYADALFQTRVTDVEWDDDREHWRVRTNRGDLIEAQFVVLATGQLLNRPKLPGIPGIEGFAGRAFHTSRWDYDYTGGDTHGGLVGLHDKKVAIIGTGSTSIQAIPHLAEHAAHLYVFQRTPSIVDERGNRPTDADWVATLEPGWQEDRQTNFDLVLEGRSPDRVLVQDQWTQIWGRPDVRDLSTEDGLRLTIEYDDEQMERIRGRIDEIVTDPRTAESLKPYYSRFCKRPCFNDEYLPTFNRANVTLVDTDGKGPQRITDNAVWFDDVPYEVDCVIYATGFESFAKTPSQSGRYTVTGRDGVTLDDKWGDVQESLHGISTHGFPNLFVLGNSRQSAASFNIPYRVFVQARHVTSVISDILVGGWRSMEVTLEAEGRWGIVVNAVRESGGDITAQMRECTPGVYNNEGGSSTEIPIVAAGFAAGTAAFRHIVDAWRREDVQRDTILRRGWTGRAAVPLAAAEAGE
jgi:cyclohexanone monooxygenase